MTRTTIEKRSAFRALHESGCFVLANPWDVGSARMLAHLGFQALATTSSGYAWTTGRPDYAVTRDDVLGHLKLLCDGVDLPVNADYESGFAAAPEEVAANVRLAVGTGVAGLSIEDRVFAGAGLYAKDVAVARVSAAKRAIVATSGDVVLVARTEGLLIDPAAVTTAIDKLVAFAEVGADCLYAPGVRKKDDIRAMVQAIAPRPLNVLALDPTMTVAELADLGVRRVSVGGALARVAWGAFIDAAKQLQRGSFAPFATAASGKQLNDVFRG